MVQRNYPTDNIVAVYFGNATALKLNQTGSFALQRATYLGSLGSALQQKSDIEVRRSQNLFGILIWQLGEIWPTGGWGTLEYSSVGFTKGQILGGRWKAAHYNLKTHLFKNTVLICGNQAACVLKHDDPVRPFKGTWVTNFIRITDSAVIPVAQGIMSFDRGAGQGMWFCADGTPLQAQSCSSFTALLVGHGCAADGSDCVLESVVTDALTGADADRHITQLTTPGQMKLDLDVNVNASCAASRNADNSVDVFIFNDGGKGQGAALYVSLTTLEAGVFEENFFLLRGGVSKVVRFLPLAVGSPPNPASLAASLRVDHIEKYLR